MRIAVVLVSSLLIGLAVKAPVYGDIVVFKVPTTKVTFVLQGKAISSRAQPTINFTHASKQVFDLPQGADTKVITLPTLNQIGSKRVLKAKGDEAAMRDAAVWCLDHGLLPEFHRAIDQLSAINASEPFAAEVKRLKEEFAKPVADTAGVEAELLKEYGGSSGRVLKSAHFLLAHDGEKPEKTDIKRKRPEARIEQLEQLLELFVMKCAERGLPVRVPTAPLKVAVANIPKKVTAGDRTLPVDKNIFWSADRNVLLIDERNKIAVLDGVKKLQSDVTKLAAQPKSKKGQGGAGYGAGAGAAPGATPGGGGGADILGQLSAGQLSKLTVTLQALMTIGVENHELESTSREAAYMFLANCGVISSATPRWIQDGLAAYFEFPEEMGWSKIGDLGQMRQAWYQASLQDPDRFSVTDVVTDHCYEGAPTPNTSMRAGTQAWALTHFLLKTKPEGISQYLSNFQSMPPDVVLGEDVLTAIFDQAFDGDRTAMEEAWRAHMTELRADYLILEEEEGGTTAEN